MKRILAFTAIRSEYDLMSNVYKLLRNDKEIDFRLIVSGAHLSQDYGYSIEDIKKDGFDILYQVETLIDSSSQTTRLKSGSILLLNVIDVIAKYNPDLIIFAGDREEVIVGALVGGYLEIPTMHFFGGDHAKDFHIDNPIRHATSKLSTIHMVSTGEHERRLLKMGELPERIYNIGSVALDKFIKEKPVSNVELRKFFNVKEIFKNFALVIFHPIPMEKKYSGKYFENIIVCLKKEGIKAFVSYPNIDPGNKEIITIIEKYKADKNFCFYKTLPREIFITIYKNAEFIIGNSSSGILESASIPIPAINVGIRQKERKPNLNVVFSSVDKIEIIKAIKKVQTKSFKEMLKNVKNLYGDGNSSQRAYELIKNSNFEKLLYKNEDILDAETNKILVVSVHPDDETLGCGGTLLKHKKNGDEINLLICTEIKLENGYSQDRLDKRVEQLKEVQEEYQFSNVCNLGLSTMQVDEYSMSDLITKISKIINKIKPNIIYLPFQSDIHSDHRVIFDAVYACTKSFRYPFIKKVYMMETLSETEFCVATQANSFVPNIFVNISEFLEDKLKIMQIYKTEIEEHPFPRSLKNIEALATFRGATSGYKYAESFMLLKEVQK
jgi:UDP-hydrolysing UDP-N-acetyl-D-glucosamine 2-epimerase